MAKLFFNMHKLYQLTISAFSADTDITSLISADLITGTIKLQSMIVLEALRAYAVVLCIYSGVNFLKVYAGVNLSPALCILQKLLEI